MKDKIISQVEAEQLVDDLRITITDKVESKFAKYSDMFSWDMEIADAGLDSVGIDAYVYFNRNEGDNEIKPNSSRNHRIEDDGIELPDDVVNDIIVTIGSEVEPGYQPNHVAEWEYQPKWARAYLCLTVPDVTVSDEYDESKELVKEGPGAGYTIEVNGLKLGDVISVEKLDSENWNFVAKIRPCECEVTADGYYDRFFPGEYDESSVIIDGGTVEGNIWLGSNFEDEDDETVKSEIKHSFNYAGGTLDIFCNYGAGWSHCNLPEDGQITLDRLNYSNEYFNIDVAHIDSVDMAVAINSGYEEVMNGGSDEEEEQEDDDL